MTISLRALRHHRATSPGIWRRAILWAIGLTVVAASPALAEWRSIGDVASVRRETNRVMLDCRAALVEVRVLAADLIRVRMTPGRVWGPDESWAVIKTDWPRVALDISETPEFVRLTTSELVVEIARSPCRLTFRDREGRIINRDDPGKGMAWDGRAVRVWKVLPADEYYYGLAENAGPLELGGRAIVNWNTDAYGYRWGTDPLYQSIPFLLALRRGRSYGIFFDNTYRSEFDLGKRSREVYSFGAEDGELNYYFFYGPHPKKVIQRFTELVGRMPLPPRWALGYQQCRWSYEPERRVRQVVTMFRRRRIPLDVIYLDIDYMDGYRCFTIDEQKFPHFREMIADFARMGVKVVTIIDPGIKKEPGYWVYDEGVAGHHFIRMPDGSLYTGLVWPGLCVFPDFTRSATRRWWGGLYRQLVAAGVRGFWNDMNEPAIFVPTDRRVNRTMALDAIHDDRGHQTSHRKSHNVYGMLMARATFEGIRRLRPNERPFVLSRASYAGGQRYAAAWTGDNTSTWEHLHLWIPMVLNFGLCGQPFAGPDIGGFSQSPTPELYTRFLEAGVFSPFCRTHTQKGTADQEPWSYGPTYEAINRRYIELRYRLMPTIYSLFEEAARTGIPVMRPLFLEYPDDQRTYRLDSEFLFGPHLLVAPILVEGATGRRVYLPPGVWFNFWTGEKLTGPREIDVEAPLDVIPLFARGGAIIPMQQVVQYVDEAPIDPLIINIFPSGDSTAALYEDDGLSYQYQDGTYARTRFRCHQAPDRITFHISPPEGSYRPAERSVLLRFNGIDRAPREVRRGEERLPAIETLGRLRQAERGWTYDGWQKILWVTFPDERRAEDIIINMR